MEQNDKLTCLYKVHNILSTAITELGGVMTLTRDLDSKIKELTEIYNDLKQIRLDVMREINKITGKRNF